MENEAQLLTVKQVAQILRVSNQTVRNYIKARVLPAVRINSRVYRIFESDVRKMISEVEG
jgi:excisionase family DNA binding protein